VLADGLLHATLAHGGNADLHCPRPPMPAP
jgi:hypothetical protein